MKPAKDIKYPKKVRLWAVRDNKPYLAVVSIIDDEYAIELYRQKHKWFQEPTPRLHKVDALFPNEATAARKLKGEVVWAIDNETIKRCKASRDRNGHRTVHDMTGREVSRYHVHESRAAAVKEFRRMLKDSILRTSRAIRIYERQLARIK